MNASVGDIALRPESAGDAGAVRALLEEAFGRPAEAALVERLHADGDMVLALVAAMPPAVVAGFIAFPRLQIETAKGLYAAVGLAPLAVAAPHRRRGIGSALVRAGLDCLAARREEIVFVLGDPAFYGRFGFSVEDARAFASPYQGPHFMGLRLAADAPRRGKVCYPAAFNDLG
jgi:putative acetyltransferase